MAGFAIEASLFVADESIFFEETMLTVLRRKLHFLQGIRYDLASSICHASVLASTWELAQQIEKVMCALGDYLGLEVLIAGEIHVIDDLMFAGKTTILGRVPSELDKVRRVAIIKSVKDMMHILDSIITHVGMKMICWAMPDLLYFWMRLGDGDYCKLDVNGIDESSFFVDLHDFHAKVADLDGKLKLWLVL